MQVSVQISKALYKNICTSLRRCQIIRKSHIYSHLIRNENSYSRCASLLLESRLQLITSTAMVPTGIRYYQQPSEKNNNDSLTYQCPFCSYTFEEMGFKPWFLQAHLQHCRKARSHERKENLKVILKKILDKKLNHLDTSVDSVDIFAEDKKGVIKRSNHLKDVCGSNLHPTDFNNVQQTIENNKDNYYVYDSNSYTETFKSYPYELKKMFDSVIKNEIYKDLQIQDIFSRKDLIEPYIKYNKTGKKKSYVCLQCGYESKRESVIRQHILIHTGEKPFQCPKCGKGFASQAEVTRHLITHKKDKEFECPYCDKKFNKQVNLTSHIKSHHFGEKPYICSECGKKFSTTQQLNNHKLIHSGVKPYACSYCDYRSTQKGNLTRHMRKHTKEKPHQCPYCNFKSSRKDNLLQHIQNMHDDIEEKIP